MENGVMGLSRRKFTKEFKEESSGGWNWGRRWQRWHIIRKGQVLGITRKNLHGQAWVFGALVGLK